ncbi:hypothetical protein ABZ341_27695 [Streptomyces sp. NPDC006173]
MHPTSEDSARARASAHRQNDRQDLDRELRGAFAVLEEAAHAAQTAA